MQEVGSYLSLGEGHMDLMKSWIGIEEGKGKWNVMLSVRVSIYVVGFRSYRR